MKIKAPFIIALCLIVKIQNATGQADSKKNLLFIITDQQRFDALGYAGNSIIQTPNLDSLAKMGAYFQNAYTPCAVCGPARSCILTGSTIEKTRVFSNNETYYTTDSSIMPMPTFDEILSQNGYHCEYYGKWHSVSSHTDIYQNPVQTASNGNSIFGPGGQTHIWRDELAKLGTPPAPNPGEFIDDMSKWPYIANPLDRFYGMTYQELVNSGQKHAQPDQHGKLLLDREYTITAFQAKQTIEALERLKDTTFSITCSFHFPHSPMLVPEPYYGMYPVNEMAPPSSINDNMSNSPYINANNRLNLSEYADPEKIKYMISDYYGLITEIDDWVGVILAKLNELGIADKTMVIFTSDHGEMLGAHGMREKNVFLEESAHIPLSIKLPGEIAPNTTIEGYNSSIDLFPTILDYLEIPEHESDGKSLRGLIEGTDSIHGKYAVTEWNSSGDVHPNYMIIKDGWKLLIPFTIKSNVINALYNLNTDPYETNNLLGSNPDRAQYLTKAEELKACLVEWLTERNSIHTYSVSKRDLLEGGKPTGNDASFVSQNIPDLIAGDTLTVSITMKNTGTTAWIQEGRFVLGSQAPAQNNLWGLTKVELNPGDSIIPGENKTFTFEIHVPESEGIHNFQWQMVQEGEEWFGYKTDIKQIIIGDPGAYWDDCDATTDWKSSSGLKLNTADHQQGNACLEFVGSSTDEYKKTFSTAYNSRGKEESTVLKFWYYVSDVSLFETANQVEIGSAGKPDQDEYNWSLNNLTNGWNYVTLNVSEAGKMGSPDLNAINWFRIYHRKTGVVTTRLDAIQLVDPTADPVYTLLVNNGSGDGNYFEGEQVNISALDSQEGAIFEKWVVDQGNPVIADTLAKTTTLTMGNQTTIISARFIEAEKFTLTVNNGSASGSYAAGTIVRIQADPPGEGMQFNRWIVNTGNVSIAENSSFIFLSMPDENVELTATYSEIVGLADNKLSVSEVQIYPNPCDGELFIEFRLEKEGNIDISILDLTGRKLCFYNEKYFHSGYHKINFPIHNLNAGAYLIKLNSDRNLLTNMVIIK